MIQTMSLGLSPVAWYTRGALVDCKDQTMHPNHLNRKVYVNPTSTSNGSPSADSIQ